MNPFPMIARRFRSSSWITLIMLFALPVVALSELPSPSFEIRDDYYPDIAVDSSGFTWIVWVTSFADTSSVGSADAVYTARWDGVAWDTTRVTPEWGRYLDPQIVGKSGGITVAWVELDGLNSDVITRSYNGTWSTPYRVADGMGPDFEPALCSDDSGRVWIAWQAWEGSSFDIRMAWSEGDSFSTPVNVAAGPANDRDPDIAPSGNGSIWIAWASIRNRHEELCLRRWNGDAFEAPVHLTESEKIWARNPSLAVDQSGNVWVAYFRLDRRWKYFESSDGPWQDRGSIYLLRWSGTHVGVPLNTQGNSGLVPRPSMSDVGYFVFEDSIHVYGCRPELLIDQDQRLWVFQKMAGYYIENEIQSQYWGVFGVYYQGSSWSNIPEVIYHKNAYFWDKPAVVIDGDNRMWTAWTRDHRDTEPVKTYRNMFGPDADIRVDTINVGPGTGSIPVAATLGSQPAWSEGEARTVPRYAVETPHASYEVYFGENHRHTCDFSYDGIWDCNFDDTFDMTYERMGYDWIAPSDHVEWWTPLTWTLMKKWSDLYFVPDQFVSFPGYERAARNSTCKGDQNATFRSVEDCFSADAMIGPPTNWLDLYEQMEGRDVLLTPHATAEKTAKGYTIWDELREAGVDTLAAPLRLVEIFQTCRGSYEYPGCPMETWKPTVGPDTGWVNLALDMGYRLGFISCGDHNPGNGFTAVLAEEPTRDAIFEALRQRRCYGTTFTRKPFLDFRINDHVMGEEFETETAPRLFYHVAGVDTITRIVIVKNGDTEWYVSTPGSMEDSCTFFDPDTIVSGSSAYYYLRAEEGDSGIAWSSPIWIDFGIDTGVSSVDESSFVIEKSSALLAPLPFSPSSGPLRLFAENRVPTRAEASIYTISGRQLVRWRIEGSAGAQWDGRDGSGRRASPGIYFIRVTVPGGEVILNRKIVLLK